MYRSLCVLACVLLVSFGLAASVAAQLGEASGAELSVSETSVSATSAQSVEERNKRLARGFYEDLWFSQRTDRYDRYVAEEYVVHDIGDRKNLTEPGITQKEIADFFHSQGEMTGSIDFQIAEGDLVATRWQWRLEPTSLRFRLLGGREQIPIINVFRFRDGKIVEIWNHRHDVDTGLGNLPFVLGLGIGLVFAMLGWGAAFVFWRRGRRTSASSAPTTAST